MYFVDRKTIDTTLNYMESLFPLLEKLKKREDAIQDLALERVCYMLIESIIDVGNNIIDGFIMRDPGSYADIVDILVDEKVVSHDNGESLKLVLECRKDIIQPSGKIDHDQLYEILQHQKQALTDFPMNVRTYIENELGPVSAFLPKD